MGKEDCVASSIARVAPTRPSECCVEAVAMLCEQDFERMRALIPELKRRADYEDWLDDRHRLLMGLCAAGVDAQMIDVAFEPFLAWLRFINLAPTEQALDDFATLMAVWRSHDAADLQVAAFADVSAADFAAYFEAMDAFRSVGDYLSWNEQRDASLQSALASGALVLLAPTPIDAFLEWTRCIRSDSSQATLDRYTRLALESLLDRSA